MKIPITFEQKGKTYSGFLSEVFGAGDVNVWHLMVDNYYFGRLRFSNDKWFFDSNSMPELSELADYFGQYITLWYE